MNKPIESKDKETKSIEDIVKTITSDGFCSSNEYGIDDKQMEEAVKDGIKAIEEHYNKKYNERLELILKNGHGGGNWRRLLTQEKGKGLK